MLTFKDIGEKPQSCCILSQHDATKALEGTFDLCEDNTLEYLSGYFFKRLISMHKGKACSECSSHGQKLTEESQIQSANETFLFYKRFCTSSELIKCSPLFVSYVKAIIQICLYALDNCCDMQGIGKMVDTTALTYLDPVPALCSRAMQEKLINLITRTILFYEVKWFNDKMRQKKWRNESQSMKLSIFLHT